MAKIYTEQAVSDFATTTYNHQGNVGQKLFKEGSDVVAQGQKTEQQAKEQYAQAVQIDWQNAMNGIANNPQFAANPTAMQAEMKKLNDKMASEIIDRDVKYNFLVNSNLKGQSYLNNATAQFRKNQLEQEKSQAFNNIYASSDLAGISAVNVLYGVGTDVDAYNFSNAKSEAIKNINKKDAYGNYIFSNSERLRMATDFDEYAVKSFKTAYDNLSDSEQDILEKKILNDDSWIVQSDKGPIQINAKDAISPSMMRDIKNYVRDAKYKRIAAREKERKIAGQDAILAFIDNPTKVGLDNVLALNKLSKEDKQMYEEMYEKSPNYDAETTFESDTEAYDALKNISTMPNDTEAKRDQQVRSILKYASKLSRSNTNGDLTVEKKEDYIKTAINVLADKDLAERISNMPDLSLFNKMHQFFSVGVPFTDYGEDSGPIDYTWGQFSAKEKISKITHDLAAKMLIMAKNGATNEQINSVYNKSLEEAVKAKYWYIKDIQNKPLEIGKTQFNGLSGGPYIFNGFAGDEILVKKVEK